MNETENQMVEIEFVYTDNPLQLRATIPLKKYLQALYTGLLNNLAVSEITVFTVENTAVVYSIVDAKSGKNPWSERSLT